MEENTVCMPRSRLLATLILLYGWPWIGALSVAFFATVAIGIFIDLRWVVISMMLIFLIAPLLIAYLYFYHGLKQMTAINVVPHILTLSDADIIVDIPAKDIQTDRSTDNSTDIPTREDEDCKAAQWRRLLFPYSSFQGLLTASSGYLLMATNKENGFLWIPYTSIADENTLKHFHEMLRQPDSASLSSTHHTTLQTGET